MAERTRDLVALGAAVAPVDVREVDAIELDQFRTSPEGYEFYPDTIPAARLTPYVRALCPGRNKVAVSPRGEEPQAADGVSGRLMNPFDPAAMIQKAGRVSGSHSGSVAGSRPNVRIVHLNGAALRALAHGDLAAAETVSPVALSPYLAGPQCRALWRMRSEQCDQDPSSAAWVTGIVWDELQCLAVGAAGFHGPPDSSSMVEIGYRIDPAYRRRGYARAALEALLARAAAEPDVCRVRVSIRPDNLPSSRLALQYGFRQIGEQWDDEDGLELVYEVPAGQS